MMRLVQDVLIGVGVAALLAFPAVAQESGKQAGPSAQSNSGAAGADKSQTIVVNPTAGECRSGWNPSSKWTKDKFDEYCARLSTSK